MTGENRRPLKSRGTWWAAALAKSLVRLGVSPNQISIASIVCAACAGAMFLAAANVQLFGFRAAAVIFAAVFIQLRLLCNLLDGMTAVEGGLRSKSGEIYNEFPDRVSDVVILAAVGYAAGGEAGLTPWAPGLGWLAAVSALLTAYVRALGAAAGSPNYFCGPMAKPHRMALLTGACLFWLAELLFAGSNYTLVAALSLICVGCIVTICRRLRMIIAWLERRP